MFGADFFHFCLQRRGNVTGCFVGNDRNSLLRLELQTYPNRVARTGYQFGINRVYGESVGHEKEVSFNPELGLEQTPGRRLRRRKLQAPNPQHQVSSKSQASTSSPDDRWS